MGKNKKNKNQNRVNLDSDNDNDNNDRQTLSPPPIKKNIFSQLENVDDNTPNERDKNCLINITNTTDNIEDNKKPDEYFARAYHTDDYENDYENAIILYKLSIEHDNFYYKGISAYNLALIYEEKQNDENTAEIYYKFSADKYNYKHAFINLGLLYYNKKDYNNAFKYLHIAITKFYVINIYYEYAQTLEKLGNHKDAFKYLQYHLMLKNANIREKNLWHNVIKNIL
jgi:tetratricopeptide (TPR) repeat protein